MNLGTLNLPPSPIVMGILNVSPDSIEHSVARGEQILREGAAIIDVGVDSANLNQKLSVQEELDRVIHVIEILSNRVGIPISVSTSNPEVMLEAVKSGAKIINDVRSLTKPGALNMAIKLGVPVCLMHMRSDPVTMQLAANAQDVVTEVYQYLEGRITACVAEGLDAKKIIIDPGFGFGKNLQHNLTLLRGLQVFKNLHMPLLVGVSHKSMIGQILDATADQRVFGSVAAAIIAVGKGADIIRAHDVQATVDAIKVFATVAGP